MKVLLCEELSSVRGSAMGVWCFIGKQHLPLWEFLPKFSLQALSFFFFFGRNSFNCFSSPSGQKLLGHGMVTNLHSLTVSQ